MPEVMPGAERLLDARPLERGAEVAPRERRGVERRAERRVAEHEAVVGGVPAGLVLILQDAERMRAQLHHAKRGPRLGRLEAPAYERLADVAFRVSRSLKRKQPLPSASPWTSARPPARP
jgi:hypothetical protein